MFGISIRVPKPEFVFDPETMYCALEGIVREVSGDLYEIAVTKSEVSTSISFSKDTWTIHRGWTKGRRPMIGDTVRLVTFHKNWPNARELRIISSPRDATNWLGTKVAVSPSGPRKPLPAVVQSGLYFLLAVVMCVICCFLIRWQVSINQYGGVTLPPPESLGAVLLVLTVTVLVISICTFVFLAAHLVATFIEQGFQNELARYPN